MVAFCHSLLAAGTCNLPRCRLRHDALICQPCRTFFPSRVSYDSHIQGRKHRNTVTGRNAVYFCSVCEVNIHATSWDTHVAGRPHRRRASLRGISAAVERETPTTDAYKNLTFCATCLVHVGSNAFEKHAASFKHKQKEKFTAFRALLDELEKDKHGIEITGSTDFGIVEPSLAESGVSKSLLVNNSVSSSRIYVVEVRLLSRKGATLPSSPFSVQWPESGSVVLHGKPLSASVTLRQEYNGRCEDRVEITFEDAQLEKRFIIARSLTAIVRSKADHDLLRPTAPYVARRRTTRLPETNVVEGVFPQSLKAIPYLTKLPHANIPKQLESMLGIGTPSEVLGRVRKMFLPSALDSETYSRHFKHLLWIEESRMEHDLEIYDIPDATLSKHNQYYYLRVPGLAEKRPSVLVGDRILVQPHGSQEGHWYEGGVHVVRKEEVGLQFHHSSRGWAPGQHYRIHFKLNRYPLRRQHLALDTAFTSDRVLFPSAKDASTASHYKARDFPLSLFNPLINTNPAQYQAVVSIIKQPKGSTPFIIFGPPGTGKTMTMVEAILQVLDHDPRARVLACAPSNSAADLLANGLKALGTDCLFRFYAPSRYKDQVEDGLLPFTCLRDDRHFSVPHVARMKSFRVVVTTCVSASVVSGIGIPRGHYSHIFIDEAGQATEPESMVSIKTMADNSTNIVLSGDPKQLGPIIRSKIARELKLDISYIERLMERPLYAEGPIYGKTFVKLVKNFRSHAFILKYPNDRFYGGELEPCADRQKINLFIGSKYLPSKRFPIVFHAISGKDDREAASPSFFNADEAVQVKQYVEALRADRSIRITDKDIGVITPYHAQVGKIRTALRTVADGVKVASTEEFQGQERPVIIISTVRSSREFVKYDLRHTLGFVANPRRFNVAVTRAQALLIVVGDPNVLSLDPLWRAFLNYIHVNGGWKGPPPSWDTQEEVDELGGYDVRAREAALADMNALADRMEGLTLVAAAEDQNLEASDANVDRPWREVE